jgi:hypothetical protein
MASRCWSRACFGRIPSRAISSCSGVGKPTPSIVFWDGIGLCLFAKRLEDGVFLWPLNIDPRGTLMLSPARLSMPIDGVAWRAPERQWRPGGCCLKAYGVSGFLSGAERAKRLRASRKNASRH